MRSRRTGGGGWYAQHTLPFLSIMLGLIAVMALASIGLSSVNRQAVRKQRYVQLANIPPNLIPIHIVCEKEGFRWRQGSDWQLVTLGEVLVQAGEMSSRAGDFLSFIADSAVKNRALSYANKQNTIILWIRPDGVLSAAVLEGIIQQTDLPIRIGKLPLQSNEAIKL